jgi:hypothetical protein
MLRSRFTAIFGKKWAFFSKTDVKIKILHNLPLLRVKNANFLSKKFAKIIVNHCVTSTTKFEEGWPLPEGGS